MSRIKDLLAVERNIEELMPTDKERVEALLPAIQEKVYKSLITQKTEDYLWKFAEIGAGLDDEGHEELYVENFVRMCEGLAEDAMNEYVEQNALDIDEKKFFEVVEWVGAQLANHYADLESDIIKDAR